MDVENVKPFLDKKVIIESESYNEKILVYTGVIRRINPDETILMTDKFGKLISLNVSRIMKIQEVAG